MNLKATTSAAAAVLAAAALACHAQTRQSPPAPAPTPAPAAGITTIVSPDISPEDIANIKNLVFADLPLAEMVRGLKAKEPETQEEPARSLYGAVEDMERGRPAEARGKLRRVLAMPGIETRVRLLVWNTLRGLGERPPPAEARQVQGVVCELHNEVGVGTLAVYADGGVRWIGGKGKVSVVDSPGEDAALDALVRDLLKLGEPLVRTFPARDKRLPREPSFEHFRVTVLTYGGIHAGEFYGPGIDSGHVAEPILYASGRLVGEVLPEFEKKHRPEPAPPGGRP